MTKQFKIMINETLSAKWVLLILALLLVTLLAACKSEELKKGIEAEVWLVDSEDASLYRVVKTPDGREVEQYILIQGNNESEQFLCWYKDDVKKWTDVLARRCN